jgi:hypothetical protein
MNPISVFTLKILRKIYAKLFYVPALSLPECEQDPDVVSRIIYNKLTDDKPCMIARFGSTELTTLVNYIGVKQQNRNIWKYIKGESLPWWWNAGIMEQMQQWSGFFPPTQEKIEQFCELMLEDMKEVDVLGSWLPEERYFEHILTAKNVHLRLLEPFWAKTPWTRLLKDKKVLVIHPFSKSILKQYKKRRTLFRNKELLPKFKTLNVIPAVQSLGKADEEFGSWFEALDYQKSEVNKFDFDICLIGAGAYGLPLAAHIKRIGKKAVHMGGSLQLLFGIKGSRWEDPNYGVKEWGIPYASYSSLINDSWIRPARSEKPQAAQQVEGACYW